MSAVVDSVVTAGTSAKSKAESGVAIAATRLSLLGQDPDEFPRGTLDFPPFLAKAAYRMLLGNLKARANGVTSKFVNGTTLMGNEVGKAIYEDFLPKALAEGKFVASPEPLIRYY
jgi:hypothetical protein